MVIGDASRVLLVSADHRIVEVVQRLAAVVGLDVEHAGGATLTRSSWGQSALVLIGADCASSLVDLGLVRRPGVLILATDESDEQPMWRAAVGLGAEHVVVLSRAEAWLVQRLSEAADGPSRGGAVTVVTSASGGAGVSTLAYSLAATASSIGRRAVLVDGDPLGGGLDLLLGGEDVQGVRWPDLAHAAGRLSAMTLHYALPRVHGVSVLAHSRTLATEVGDDAWRAVLDAGRRGFDDVLVYLPRLCAGWALGDADRVVLLVPATLRGIAGARQGIERLDGLGVNVRVVVRRTARGLSPRDVERAVGLADLSEVPEHPRLTARAEHGEPFVAGDGYGRAVRLLHDAMHSVVAA